ncbi:RIP metalloprotease RseP [Tissierella sp. Yu-01]|uniref:RIP metalloprotease RseP n=1 Tax=Tissierella sp. Yu-01 TaxID=3035694 RepID=UPI00240D7198|nr:RIP metalloprotease RseP [Tissierella sp. Yu-01]WFA09767.1 RIP metalloprotease RseP [Tissierella sp. Yu-01]
MQTAIAAIFVFLLVILLHELGHFIVAKLVGIKVNEFSIGMGPKIFQKTKGETQYTLRILPIGGYCKMEGEDENSEDPRSFSKVSPIARIAVVAAGAIMNFVLALIVLTIVSFNVGAPSITIDDLVENSPAEAAGILPGDKVTAINGIKINNWDNISNAIGESNPEKEIDITLLRDNEELNLTIKPIIEDGRTIIGIIPRYEKSVSSAIKGGIDNTVFFIDVMFDFIKSLFKGEVTTNDLSGPIGVISEIGKAADSGFTNLLFLLGFISVNLGFFNLLPIPALDGSRILFLLLELVRGKPINPDKEGFIHMIGFFLLIALMLIVTYKDLIRINIL